MALGATLEDLDRHMHRGGDRPSVREREDRMPYSGALDRIAANRVHRRNSSRSLVGWNRVCSANCSRAALRKPLSPEFSLVGREGLEPPTPCASCKCASNCANGP